MGGKSNFSEAQIIDVVKEVEGGAKLTEVARRVGVTVQTRARWRVKYSGVTVTEAKENGGSKTRMGGSASWWPSTRSTMRR